MHLHLDVDQSGGKCLENIYQCRNWLALDPQLCKFLPRNILDLPWISAEAEEVIIVKDDQGVAGAHAHIELKSVCSGMHRARESHHRVLRLMRAIPAMTKNQRPVALLRPAQAQMRRGTPHAISIAAAATSLLFTAQG